MPSVTGWWAESGVTIDGIPSAEAFGSLALFRQDFVALLGIPSTGLFGDVVMIWPQDVSLTGLASAATFGSFKAYPPPQNVTVATGVVSAATFGTAIIRSLTVGYSATGAGAITTSSGSYSITTASGDVVVGYLVTDREAAQPVMSCDGVLMRLVSQVRFTAAFGVGVKATFVSVAQTAGAKTVTYSAGTGFISSNATSYTNVGGVGLPKIDTGSGNTSQTETSPSRGRVVQAFGVGTNAAFASPAGGINRWLDNNNASLTISDSPGAATFSATKTGSINWVGTALKLFPEAPLVPYYNNISSLVLTLSSGVLNFNHIANAGDYVVVNIVVDRTDTISSVTHDGNTMTQLGTTVNFTGASGNASLVRYGISAVGAGSKTISFTKSGGAWCVADAVSIRNVTSVVSTTTATNNNSQPSHALTPTTGQLVVQSFGTRVATDQIRGGVNVGDSLGGTTSVVATSLANTSTTITSSQTLIPWGSIATVFS